jgi:hypothetical protein
MTPAINVVLLPYPVPVGNAWLRRCPPPPYPTKRRDQWPPKTSVPVRDVGQVRRMITDAKRMLAEDRASRLLRELDR